MICMNIPTSSKPAGNIPVGNFVCGSDVAYNLNEALKIKVNIFFSHKLELGM